MAERLDGRVPSPHAAVQRSCAAVDQVRPRPAAIWSLSVSDGDLVTVVLDIEKESDQIGR